MKTKTRKLIAGILATAVLGAAVGVSAYAFGNTENNDFGFKGTYNLNALAAEKATETTITVGGATVDVTDTLTIKSDDEANTYTLFVSVVDTSDLEGVSGDIYVGYSIGGNYYNGFDTTLTQTVYSSLTIGGETINASSYTMTNATNSDKTAIPMFIIAEVVSETVGENEASLVVTNETQSANEYIINPTDSNTKSWNEGLVVYAGEYKSASTSGPKYTDENGTTITLDGYVQFGGGSKKSNGRYFTIDLNKLKTDNAIITVYFTTNTDSTDRGVGLYDTLPSSDGFNTITPVVSGVVNNPNIAGKFSYEVDRTVCDTYYLATVNNADARVCRIVITEK